MASTLFLVWTIKALARKEHDLFLEIWASTIPFLMVFPDRVGDPHAGHAFSDNNYVDFTAWPACPM